MLKDIGFGSDIPHSPAKVIVVLMGSTNRNGSTGILVDNFKRGAEENGHSVEVIDVCHADIHPCIGCVKCGYESPCVQKDVERTRKKLLASDMVVFATPLFFITCQSVCRYHSPDQEKPDNKQREK